MISRPDADERKIMLFTSNRTSPTRIGVKWLLLSLAFVWLVGCAGLGSKKQAARDPFADQRFSCGEDKPGGATTASLSGGRG